MSSRSKPPTEKKVPTTDRLSEAKIETALDLVVFRQELVDGTRALLGLELRTAPEAMPIRQSS